MKITSTLLLSAATVMLFSCSEKAETTQTEAGTTQTQTISAEGSTDNLTEPLPSMPAAQTAEAGKLNPAHGEPGHRCDIAVGAPLNSSPAATTAQPQPSATPNSVPKPTVMSMPSTTPPPVQSTTGSGKINPPHGEPGHVCSKPVGQPL